MKVHFAHKGGWNGGQWDFDGLTTAAFEKQHGVNPFPVKGMLMEIVNPTGAVIPGVVSHMTRTITGVDHDHGHRYDWSYEEPTFLIGTCPVPVPAELIWASGYTIRLEVS
jgi:hypothetical protein